MNCIEIERNLDAFFDGEITSSKEIEAHLENCVSCQTSFANLQTISRAMKQNFAVSAPTLLGDKVMSAFQNYHEAKRREKVEKKQQTKKIGWFAIPRFAWAAILILFALGMISAFQIGKMSASEISVVMPEVQENINSNQIENELNTQKAEMKIVEVPVIREKIVEVPVIREKIFTKTVYVNRTEKNTNVLPTKEDFALTNKIEDNKYLTRSNLEGFQPVSEMNLRVSKEENEK